MDAPSWGAPPAVAFTHHGNPVIAFVEPAGGDLVVARCRDAVCSDATTTIIDQGSWPNVAIGPTGLPLVTYTKDGHLFVTACLDVACTWVTRTALTGGGPHRHAIVLDAGHPGTDKAHPSAGGPAQQPDEGGPPDTEGLAGSTQDERSCVWRPKDAASTTGRAVPGTPIHRTREEAPKRPPSLIGEQGGSVFIPPEALDREPLITITQTEDVAPPEWATAELEGWPDEWECVPAPVVLGEAAHEMPLVRHF